MIKIYLVVSKMRRDTHSLSPLCTEYKKHTQHYIVMNTHRPIKL